MRLLIIGLLTCAAACNGQATTAESPTAASLRAPAPPSRSVAQPAPAAVSPCTAIPTTRTRELLVCELQYGNRWFATGNASDPRACLPAVPATALSCTRDADCVEISLSACGRCNGGAAIAVNREAASGLRASHSNRCPVACTEEVCSEPARPVCLAGQCAFPNNERPTTHCSDQVPCEAGQTCHDAPPACGGGRQCLSDGVEFLPTSNGCSVGVPAP